MRISVVVASHNEGELLWKTVRSCLEAVEGLDAEVLVADDASTDGSVAALRGRYPDVPVHAHAERRGVGPTKDLGGRAARGETVLFLDAHCKPEPGSVGRLAEGVEATGGRAVLAPAVRPLDAERWENGANAVGYGGAFDLETLAFRWTELDALRPAPAPAPLGLYEAQAARGCCVAVARATYERLRGFDAGMRMWGVEDVDFSLRAWLLGHPVLVDPGAAVGHRFRPTFATFSAPPDHVVANSLRTARKSFTGPTWDAWLARFRARHDSELWARAWALFESNRDGVEREREYVQAHRVRSEGWYATRFNLTIPGPPPAPAVDESADGRPAVAAPVARVEPPRKLILRNFYSPGDVLMMTAAVRDLHLAHPGRFETDVRTSTPALWEHNPYLTPLDEGDAGVEVVEMEYPLIHKSNDVPLHFIHGYAEFLSERLGVPVPTTHFHGDVHLSDQETAWMSQVEETGFEGRFWIIMAGGKYDYTAKWWDPARYQKVVDHFAGRILFVQCGDRTHWHPRLRGVLNLVGKTDGRQFVRLMHHADGVVCPVTFAMHLAAAVPTRRDRPTHRACVVVAGGREPAHWEAYPHHQFLNTNGTLPCCLHGGCWRSRCQTLGDGDPKDADLCERPVPVSPTLQIPRCLDMVRAEDVIRRIELYYEGGALTYNDRGPVPVDQTDAPACLL